MTASPPAFLSRSTGRQLKAVLFDTFGTVVDWRSGVATELGRFADRHGLTLDPSDLADKWRAEYQPSMETVRSGQRGYVPLDQLHLENLKRVLERSGLSLARFASADLEELNLAWERLPAWPDVREGLQRLKSRYVIGPLSNGNTALLVNMGKNAGLPWDVVVGLDLLRVYKPDPAAYLGAASVLRLHPGEVMLVAAHNGDLAAARAAGLATAFVPRATEHGPGQATDLAPASDWDAVAADFIQLASTLTPSG
ncbi:MAG TPA: haloacid dehalogenase type II [Arthrobacter sp.]|jgi:2-haloacid dehalogenase|uniref:haloacid dehalogenase type II n=1 Tax=Arthrobacter sp. TaxID=1667 RepID=UPI002F3FECCC